MTCSRLWAWLPPESWRASRADEQGHRAQAQRQPGQGGEGTDNQRASGVAEFPAEFGWALPVI
jgi:hypothetical protein